MLAITLDLEETLTHKQCRVCGEIKHIEKFYKHPFTKDGKDTYCKSCRIEYAKLRYRLQDRKDFYQIDLLNEVKNSLC